MRELDEALMDRTTASLNRRNKVSSMKVSGQTDDLFAHVQPTFIHIDLSSDEPLKTITPSDPLYY